MTLRNPIQLLLCVILILLGLEALGQNQRQKALEQQRLEILKEIEWLMPFCLTQKTKRPAFNSSMSLDQKIKSRERWSINQPASKLFDPWINSNLNTIDQLQEELKDLKEDYAEMIRQSYKSKSQQSRLMFILSSENFLQAYKRLQYMKQYSQFRRTQVLKLRSKKRRFENSKIAIATKGWERKIGPRK